MTSIRLAEKQKRIKNLREFLVEEKTIDPGIRSRLEGTLADFQRFLSSVWNAKELSPAQQMELSDFERQLELLSDEARLVVNPRASQSR